MKKKQVIEIMDTNTEQIQTLIQQKITIWTEYVVFSKLWWLALLLSVMPWILWILFRKKESTDRLLHAGLFVMVISLVLDVFGDQFGFWHYRFNLIPVLPTYFPWDLTLMPTAVMFFIQIKPKANPYIKAILFALFSSYVGEPLFELIGVYEPEIWRYSYSVPIQIVIFLIAYYLTKRDQYKHLA